MLTKREGVIHKICTKCIMDTSDPNIEFDGNGVCNHCRTAEEKLPNYHFTVEQEKVNLISLKEKIKHHQIGEYDSILGLSGGVDSSYVAYLAMKMGLNPLCVHFDNGWNSDTAVKNIKNIINVTGFDLYTYVIDWPEFRDLQRAFFKSGVIDIEMLTDHAIFASLFKIRRENNIKIVLSGSNYATEQGIPNAWVWPKMDLRNIKGIQKRFGDMNLKSFPAMGRLSWMIMRNLNVGGTFIAPLNMVTYKKTSAMEVLSKVFDWQYYGGKHYESVFTKFYQAYVLPEKFGVDKRKVHFSDLLRNGEMTREQADRELKKTLYDPKELKSDKKFVLKKLGFTEDEFEKIIRKKPVPHDFYPTSQPMIRILVNFVKALLKCKDKTLNLIKVK